MTILDRFEGNIAFIESDEEMIKIPRAQLPEDVREGDVLFLDEDQTWQIDSLETAARRARLALLRERSLRKR